MNPPFGPLTLGDIFEKTFSLIGKTFFRNILVGLLLLLFPVIIMAIAADEFYSSLGDMQNIQQINPAEVGLDSILSIFGPVAFFFLATFLLAFCVFLAQIAISIIVSQELLSHPLSIFDALSETFSMKCLYGIGQGCIKYGLLIVGAILIGIIFALLAVISPMVIVILAIFLLIPLIAFIWIKWFFSLTAVAVDDMTPMDSLRTSWHLSDGYWWRTFGILLLLFILSQFVIYIISLPITFGTMWDFYKDYFTMLGKTRGTIDQGALAQMVGSLGPSVAIGTGISELLSLLITPIFTVVMYYDLRARGNMDTVSEQRPFVIQESPSEPMDLSSL
jgi:hypothetical protein